MFLLCAWSWWVEPQQAPTLDPQDPLTPHPPPSYTFHLSDIPADVLAEIRRHFDLYDVDGSGRISLDELRRGYEHEGRDPEEALGSIKYYDLDGDGEINFDEFARWSFDAMRPRDLNISSSEIFLTDDESSSTGSVETTLYDTPHADRGTSARTGRTTTMAGACLFLRCARSWWPNPNTCPKHLTHRTL